MKHHGGSREPQGLQQEWGMGGLTGDKLGSDCGGSFMLSKRWNFFLQHCGAIGGIKQGAGVGDVWILGESV